MPSQLLRVARRSASDPSWSVFLVTVVLCFLRARDLPSVDVHVGGTELSIGPADLALLATAALGAIRLRARRSVPSPWLLSATAAFALLLAASAVPNGANAVTAAGKLAELGALTLGAAAFLDSRERLVRLATLVVAFTAVAAAWASVGFVRGGGRQASFIGEHDLAALGTIAVAVGLAYLHTHPGRPKPLALVALVAGGLGIALGASLAGLLGLYLVAGIVLGATKLRSRIRPAAMLATLVVVAAVTASTLAIRSGELGFLQELFGPEPERQGQYAASWSQRLIFAYVGGRVFLDRPVLGTGWHGELPREDFARYLPDARERFPDQPPHYFPPAEGTLIPQQTYDQVLFQLGLVGAAFFLAVGGLALRASLWTARSWPRTGDRPELAYLPLAWLAGVAGALAGAALFGGAPLTATFWLTLGVVAAGPALVPVSGRA